jgi:2-dehydro-3-deoxyphosphogluconate aldolase/(4S)-4-hydroxy-2-oxoglutarate aldolase
MMENFSWDAFNRVPLVGIIRSLPADKIDKLASLYADAGLTTLEITLNTAGAADLIHMLQDKYKGTLNIGAGTVCSMEELDLAINAGAQFIVAPVVNEAVVKKCVANKIPVFPGAYTPSEIYHAWSLGADIIKLFPATRLGVEYIKEVLAPLNKVRLMPTGGVSLENCLDFFKAGAVAVGMGSNLFPRDLVNTENWKALAENFKTYAKKMQVVKETALN